MKIIVNEQHFEKIEQFNHLVTIESINDGTYTKKIITRTSILKTALCKKKVRKKLLRNYVSTMALNGEDIWTI